MEHNEEAKNSSAATLPNVALSVFYMNGFTVGLTTTEVGLIMLLNGQPFQVVNMPLSTAKSLVGSLEKSLEDYEAKTKQKVLSMEELKDILASKTSV